MGGIERAWELGGQLEDAFQSVGMSMMGADFAAKLLAWVLVMGGGNEAVTHHERVVADIAVAQAKFRLRGGERPDAEGCALVRARVGELRRGGDSTPWLREIYARYGLRKHPA